MLLLGASKLSTTAIRVCAEGYWRDALRYTTSNALVLPVGDSLCISTLICWLGDRFWGARTQ